MRSGGQCGNGRGAQLLLTNCMGQLLHLLLVRVGWADAEGQGMVLPYPESEREGTHSENGQSLISLFSARF